MAKIVHEQLNQFPPSMFMSGVESNKYWDIVVNQSGAKSVLTSYYYYRNQKDKDALRKRLAETPDVRILIDSGAFTLKQDRGGSLSKKEVEEYLDEYVAWVRDNKDVVFAVVAMDLENVFGEKQVLEWNRKYFEPLEIEGIPVCYIWHMAQGFKAWETYCQKYHYVGIASDIFESKVSPDTTLRRLLSIAKKHGAVVHGMAFTKAQYLVKFPLYSTDSTTWVVGQKYGELNWWDGRKMTRLSKKEWQRNYKSKLLKPPFNADWDRLMNGMGGKGDTYELLRLNVMAFIDGEAHIRKRVKNQSYWLKGRRTAEPMRFDRGKVVQAKLPSTEWFEGNMDDYPKYVTKLNISTEYDKDTVVAILKDYRRFIAKDEELLEDWDDDRFIENAKHLADTDCDTVEDAIEVLYKYFVENATGERNDYNPEEESDEEQATSGVGYKERDDYEVDEDSYTVDISEEDLPVTNMLPAPSGMDEIAEYDKRLAGAGIVVARDNGGRFVKGHKVMRKPKNIMAQHYPKLVCDTCYKSGDCPKYVSGYVCAFDKQFKAFDTRNMSDVLDAMASLVNTTLERTQKAYIFETLDGGMPTGEVTGLIDQSIRLLTQMRDVHTKTPSAILNQRKTISADGTTEVETTLRANPSQEGVNGGILSQLFSGFNPSKDSDDDLEVIDVESVPVEESTKVKPKKKLQSKKKKSTYVPKLRKFKYEKQK